MNTLLQNTSWNNTLSMTATPFSMAGIFANLIGIFIVLVLMAVAPAQLSRPFWSSFLGTNDWAGTTSAATPVQIESAAPTTMAETRADESPRDPPKRDRYEAIRV